EKTSEFLLFSLTATAAVALIAKGDLHFTKDRVGGKQFLQRTLLRRQRILARFLTQGRRRAFHLFRGLSQVVSHLRDLLLSVDVAETPAHAVQELQRVGAQFLLTRGDSFVTVFTFLIRVFFAFTNQPVSRRDQILLPARQRVLILIAPSGHAAALLLRLFVLHLKRFHFNEVDVAGGFVTRVARLRVIRNEVAGFEVVLFKEERVRA